MKKINLYRVVAAGLLLSTILMTSCARDKETGQATISATTPVLIVVPTAEELSANTEAPPKPLWPRKRRLTTWRQPTCLVFALSAEPVTQTLAVNVLLEDVVFTLDGETVRLTTLAFEDVTAGLCASYASC